MYVEDKRRVLQGMDREKRQLTGRRARRTDRGKKRRRNDTRQSEAGVYIIPPEAFRIFIVTATT